MIQNKYKQCCETPSDINELLPYLKKYADKCESVCELGVRSVVSTYAFLASKAKMIYGYDIETQPQVAECIELCKKENRNWTFIEADILQIKLPKVDFIFIDTFHTAAQCSKELELHAKQAKKYIGFHDIATYWENAELSYKAVEHTNMNSTEGLKYAIEPFLKEHPEWIIDLKLEFNNGLLILKKI